MDGRWRAEIFRSCRRGKGRAEADSPQDPMKPVSSEGPISCRAVAAGCGEPIYFLRFELVNSGPASIELETYDPFMAFSVSAWAGGQRLTVHQPVLDIPVRRAILRLLPQVTVTVGTPIRLRIAEGAEAGTDGFVWTIAHARETTLFEVKLELPAPFDVGCRLVFE